VQLFEWIAEGIPYATFSFTVEDLAVNPPTFPGSTEALTKIESFPKGETPENILGTDGKFWTPLIPIDELSSNTESFPQRDEILESILDEPLIFPGEQIPTGTYAYPTSFDSNWSEGYENGENPNIIISPATQADFGREAVIRQDLRNNSEVSKANKRNISFADYQFTDQFGNVRTGAIESFSGSINVDDYALFVPLQDRVLRSVTLNQYNKAVDTEAKILEQILGETTKLDSGIIRIYTTRPVCDSCGIVIEEFLRFRPNIKIEVVEGS